MSIDVRRANERGHTRTDWLDARHSFSYGSYYEPDNLGFGPLQACNEDRVAAGFGYDLHRHREVEIVTWMLDGELVHTDDAGSRAVLTPATAQLLGAGAGAWHGEHAGADGAHYVQMWVRASVSGLDTTYALHDFAAELGTGRWVAVASGAPDSRAPLRLRQLDAELNAVRLAAGASTTVPVADLTHLQVTSGSLKLAGRTLKAGDAARLTDVAPLQLAADTAAEVLVWRFYR